MMDSKEVMEKLNHIRRYPHDSSASDAIDDLFDEWRRQAERIAELEAWVEALQAEKDWAQIVEKTFEGLEKEATYFHRKYVELEAEKVQLTTICAALNQDNEKLRTLAHQKINELIDALDKIAELEKENKWLRWMSKG